MATRRRSVKDFQFGNKIGEGSYSTVYKAVDSFSRKVFAIKILSKSHIVKEKKIKYVNIEKQTLNRLGHHPGIVTLYYTFQDESSLFFVIDFAEYGELLTLIRKLGSLNEVASRYYLIQLVDAIKFMHSKGVIHRDLKPENILLNHDMKLMITDFGAAKIMDGENEEPKSNILNSDNTGNSENSEHEKAASFVGTAEYVSPELLQNNECGYESDIWAVGCIFYQFIVGFPPFKGSTEYLTFEKIIGLDYQFPNYFIPESIKHLIKNILIIDPKKRYTIQDIQSHIFFKGVPWSDFNFIWKRNPPKIESYDPRFYSNGGGIPSLENQSPVGNTKHKNFYKKPLANSSKTLDIINSTYVPSQNHIMTGTSPKKNYPQMAKSYPKYNRSVAPSTSATNLSPGSNNGLNHNASAAAVQAYNQNSLGPKKTNGPSSPAQRFNGNASTPPAISQQHQQHLQQSLVTPPQQGYQQASPKLTHDKQTSNASINSGPSRKTSNGNNYFYPKPQQNLQKYSDTNSQSLPSSPISFTNHDNVLQESPLEDPMRRGSDESEPKSRNGSSNEVELNALNTSVKTKDALSAASEALLTAQKFKVKNLFATSSTSNLSADTLKVDSDDSMSKKTTQHPYGIMRLATNAQSSSTFTSNFQQPNSSVEPPRILPYESNRVSPSSNSFSHFDKTEHPHHFYKNQDSSGSNFKSGHEKAASSGSGSFSFKNNRDSEIEMNSSLFASTKFATDFSSSAFEAATAISKNQPMPVNSLPVSALPLSPSLSSKSPVLNSSAIKAQTVRSPTIKAQIVKSPQIKSPGIKSPLVKSPNFKSTKLDLDKNSDSLLDDSKFINSSSNPFAPNANADTWWSQNSDPVKNDSGISNQAKSSSNKASHKKQTSGPQSMKSPVIYFDEDISPKFKSETIPEEITSMLYSEEQIIKLDTVVVSSLSFEKILKSSPDLSMKSNHGQKLKLTDKTINEIIKKNDRIIDYYARPEVMMVTTLGRLFIIQSIDFSNKLFEIKLTDNKISLYDYEFDEDNPGMGYLLVELIDKKLLMFLSPHDHKKVSIDFEINNGITWIECLFKAKQLLRPKNSKRNVSSPTDKSHQQSFTKTVNEVMKSPKINGKHAMSHAAAAAALSMEHR